MLTFCQDLQHNPYTTGNARVFFLHCKSAIHDFLSTIPEMIVSWSLGHISFFLSLVFSSVKASDGLFLDDKLEDSRFSELEQRHVVGRMCMRNRSNV